VDDFYFISVNEKQDSQKTILTSEGRLDSCFLFLTYVMTKANNTKIEQLLSSSLSIQLLSYVCVSFNQRTKKETQCVQLEFLTKTTSTKCLRL